MNCQDLQDHYELFALGLADEPARSEIREHLSRGCEACISGVKRARELTTLIGTAAGAVTPSPNLRKRVLAAAGFESRGYGWSPWLAGAGLIALCAAIYFGGREREVALDLERSREQLRARTLEVARWNEAFAILTGPETTEVGFGQGPKGKVFVNPQRGVLLIANALPPAASGKVYEMWIIPKSGKPVAAGVFQSDTSGAAMHLDRGPVNKAATQAIAVTLENEGGASQPTSTPLIVAALE